MKKPIRFLLFLFFASLILGVIYFFITDFSGPKKNTIYKYIGEEDEIVLIVNTAKVYSTLKNQIFKNPSQLLELEESAGSNSKINEFRSVFPVGVLDENEDILVVFDSVLDWQHLLMGVDDFEGLNALFKDNKGPFDFVAIPNTQTIFYSDSLNSTLKYNSEVIQYATGKSAIPLSSEETKDSFFARNQEKIRANESLISGFMHQNDQLHYFNFNLKENQINGSSITYSMKDSMSNVISTDIEWLDSNPICSIKGNSKYIPDYFTSFLTKNKNPFSSLHLDQDSLKAYSNGQVQMVVKSVDTLYNEFITYEYDDNFEKVEVKTVKEEVFINFYLLLGDETGELWKYLNQKKWIQNESGETLVSGMPFKTFASETEQGVFISSTRRAPLEFKNSESFQFSIQQPQKIKTLLDIVQSDEEEKSLNLESLRRMGMFSQVRDGKKTAQFQIDFLSDEGNGLLEFLIENMKRFQ